MSRDKFLFQQSARLYRQSESLAEFLLDTFLNDAAPFKETFVVLEKQGCSRLSGEGARKKALDVAWKHLIAISGALDARSVIPGLLEAIEQYYYSDGSAKIALPWLGTAMKTASSIVWKNLGSVSASVKAQEQVGRLVAAAGAWEQLQLHLDQARALEIGVASFTPIGVLLDAQEDKAMRLAWNEFAGRRGLALRTLNDCAKVIWHEDGRFVEAVSDVLDGEKPTMIPLFRGTVFEEIGPNPDFWLGLSARIQIMAHAAKFRSLGRDNATRGISIFESFGIRTGLLGSDVSRANAVIRRAFWHSSWHAQRLASRDWLSNLLVERPAIRIDDRTFVVAVTNIGDSINCFVEHSVFRYMGYTGVPVPEEAFRRYVSQPFEDRAIACFVECGWRADHVSESGAWSGMTLYNANGSSIPGEVDVLAMHPDGCHAILAECKVLSSPVTSSKLLNVAQKLGATDSEGFHSKLDRKATWLRETAAFKNVEILRLLLVDEGAFLGKGAPNLVLDMEELQEILSNV